MHRRDLLVVIPSPTTTGDRGVCMRRRPRFFGWISLLFVYLNTSPATAVAAPIATAPRPQTSTLRISIALVDQQLTVHAVPLHSLRVFSALGDTVVTRTSIEGTSSVELASGPWTVASVAAVSFAG